LQQCARARSACVISRALQLTHPLPSRETRSIHSSIILTLVLRDSLHLPKEEA